VIFDRKNESIKLLLIQRKHDPFAGKWALPGGFVNENEPLAAAAARELREETGMRVDDLIQIGAFGDPGRDPRGWVVTIGFTAIVGPGPHRAMADDDAADARWFDIHDLPPLAFDHDKIISRALRVIGKE
jgi:8-oxo-dGTP diphosphatase